MDGQSQKLSSKFEWLWKRVFPSLQLFVGSKLK